MAKVTNADVYKAALEHVRQLSVLRFAILTVFMTASGALFNAYYTPARGIPLGPTAFLGFWLALVFLVCEITLSFTMSRQNKVAREMAGQTYKTKFTHRHWLLLWPVRVLLPSIHLFIGIFWGRILYSILCVSQ